MGKLIVVLWCFLVGGDYLVSICTSGTSCVSVLSEVDRSDPTPTLVLLDVPWHPQPEEEAEDGSSGEDSGGGGVLVVGGGHEVAGRHDSGVVAADMLYGLPLLKFICNEVDALRLSSLVVPVAVLTNRYDPATHATSAAATIPHQPNGVLPTPQDPPRWKSDNSQRQYFEERELRCIDIGAVDVLVSPIPMEKAKAMYVHCYRARRNVQRARRVSWVGVDEQKVPAREQSEYAYLREKMFVGQCDFFFGDGQAAAKTPGAAAAAAGRWDRVLICSSRVSELMADICKPKKTKFFSRGGLVTPRSIL